MVQLRHKFGAWYLRVARAALFAIVACTSHVALAQDDYNPLKTPDTSSPRATLNGFIDACNDLYEVIVSTERLNRRGRQFEPMANHILDCLDQSGLPEYAREDLAGEVAVHLKEVLDRIELPPDDEIPDADAIKQAGGSDKMPHWRIPDTRITIALVKEGPRQGEYLFSPDTVHRAADFYEYTWQMPYRAKGPKVSPGLREWYLSEPGSPVMAAIVHMLPDWFQTRAGELAIWKWVGLTLATVLAFAAMYVIYRFGRSRASRMRETSVVRYCVTLIFLVLAMLVPVAFNYFTVDYLTLRGNVLYFTSFASNLVFLLALLVVIVGATSRVAEVIISHPRIQPRGLDAQLIRMLCRLAGIVAGIVVFLEGGRYLGFSLTTLLASAGVGGLAVALAAQDTLKSLFGSMMILLDKPFKVGERIVVKGYDGVVEDIGLRSTKIRLLTGHQVSIPNEEMARAEIENIGRRPYIRRTATIELPSDTTSAKIKRALEILRKILEDHEGMTEDYPPRVFLRDVNESSLGIFMIFWYHPPVYWDFLAFSEHVTIQMTEQFEAEGISFAAPALDVHMTSDKTEKQ